jgi:hypothetical protein
MLHYHAKRICLPVAVLALTTVSSCDDDDEDYGATLYTVTLSAT